MGVDCRIMLPGNVRLRDVMSVMGAAAGFPAVRQDFSCNTGWSTEVEGIKCESASASDGSYVQIRFDNRHVLYFFEPDSNIGGRLMIPTSTPFWIMIGKRLVDFFGGKLDYNDCDSVDVDYQKRAGSNQRNCPSDGDAWYSFQNRLLAVKPITLQEMQEMDKLSAHGLEADLKNNEYTFDGAGNMVRGSKIKLKLAA